jgi:hypothetical protein
VDVTLLLMMMVNYHEDEGICGLCYLSDYQHSMFATCGPQDIISLVTPRLGWYVMEIFPRRQVNFPLDYRPLYQDRKLHLDTTILIDSFCPSKNRERGEV